MEDKDKRQNYVLALCFSLTYAKVLIPWNLISYIRNGKSPIFYLNA